MRRAAFGILNRWSFLDGNRDVKSSNGSISKVARFLSQPAFPGGLPGDIFFTNVKNKHFLLIFRYYCFLLGFCFMGKFRIGRLGSKLEWHEISKSFSKWRRKTFLLPRTLFIVGCPFCSQRGARSYYDCVLSCVFNLDVKLGLA